MLYLAIFLHFETIQKHSILSQALLWFCHFVIIFCPFSQVTLKSELALRKSSFCAIQLFHSSHCLTFPQVLMVNQVLTACSWYDCALLWSVQTGSILQRFAPHDAVSCRAENLVKLVFDKDIFCIFSRAAIHDMFSLMKQSMYVSPSTHHRYSQITSPKCTWNKNITFSCTVSPRLFCTVAFRMICLPWQRPPGMEPWCSGGFPTRRKCVWWKKW